MPSSGGRLLPSLAALGAPGTAAAPLDEDDVETLEDVADYALLAAKALKEQLDQADAERAEVERLLALCRKQSRQLGDQYEDLLKSLIRKERGEQAERARGR
jgi:predicted signal transduction protein with EAL and GGDEF domain